MTLTSEQIRAIQEGEPVRVVLPEIGEECVVLRSADFEGITFAKEAAAAVDEAWKEDWSAPGMEAYDRYEEHRR